MKLKKYCLPQGPEIRKLRSMKPAITVKRVYEKPSAKDGVRIKVHRHDKHITLLCAAKDEEHNHALVLKEYLEKHFD